MLRKDGRLILDTILSSEPDSRFHSHRIVNLSDKLNRNFYELLAVCKELEKEGYVELQIHYLKNGQEIPESIILTEQGIHYRQYLWSQKLKYVADKWIDFLALVVATIALIVAIAAYIRPL